MMSAAGAYAAAGLAMMLVIISLFLGWPLVLEVVDWELFLFFSAAFAIEWKLCVVLLLRPRTVAFL